MEIFSSAHTVQELYDILSEIPEHIRKEMPIDVLEDEDNDTGNEIVVQAFDVVETEGCREVGLHIYAKVEK